VAPSEASLRAEILRFSHLCYERHLLVGMDGNLSARLSPDLVLCTQASCHKGLVTDDQLVVIDMEGKKVRGRGEPTSEMAMHLACYRARPDVQAVVHAHPPLCVAFTVAGISMARCILPEVVLTLGAVPTLPYETTGTHDLARLVGDAIRKHDAVMMDRHGAVTVGDSVLSAFCKLETMEHSARIMKAARDLGQVQDLPPDEAGKLRTLGLLRYGGPPDAVARAREPGADLPESCRQCSGCGDPKDVGLGRAAGFSIARLTTKPCHTQSPAPYLEHEVRRAVMDVLGGRA
jgi:L-fuculose-phosphate aldolase